MDKTELFLKELTEANGTSGHEEEVRKIMARELEGNVDEILYDKMGSIVGRKNGTSDEPRILIEGHMDEVGFMVKEITEEGYIKLLPLGGWWGARRPRPADAGDHQQGSGDRRDRLDPRPHLLKPKRAREGHGYR